MDPEAPSSLPQAATPRRGLAIASLVLGIVGLCLSFFVVGAVLGLAGAAVGLAHVAGKRGRNGMAWWGVSLSVLSILSGILFGIAYFKVYQSVRATISSMQGGMEPASQWQGVLAPDITVTTLEGQTIRLSELKGKRVVLDFWATWCGPCVAEIPEFIKLRNEVPPDQLVLIGISDEAVATLKSFVAKKGVNYAIASATNLPVPFKDIREIPTTYFIDRKGIIQSVTVGLQGYAKLRDLALAKDSEAAPKLEPTPPASGLKQADKTLTPASLWSINLPGATAICSGDWGGNGQQEILVASDKLHVLGLDGVEKSTVSLPDRFTAIECGRDRQKGPRLLGYTTWGHQVEVIDSHGNKLWRYSALMGVDGAHWVDLDGDGTDEMIVGMNGFGGLDAVSSDGKKLWHVALANVWSQAAISAEAARPAQVFATEAGGSVRSFDAKGQALRVLKPNGEYCTKLAAGFSKQTGAVQVLALGQGSSGTEALAFDSTGQIAWSTPVKASPGTGGGADFASGDLMGDGTLDWAFLEPSGDLALATTDGKKVATIAGGSGITGFTIVSDAQGHGLLVVLRGASLEAFSFK